MNNIYNPIMLGSLYVAIRNKYYSRYKSNGFNPNDFRDLGLYLQKEEVNPLKYFDFVFGMCEYQRPLKPKSLIDARLILRFKSETI